MEPKYTEYLYNLMNDENVRPLIDDAMSEYPLYQSKIPENEREFIPYHVPTREELNNKILNYYKYREIGFETIARFIDELKIALNEIMPYYNQLFYTADMDYNPLYNADYKRIIERERADEDSSQSTGSDSSTGNSTSIDVNYTKSIETSTPQDQLSITAQNMNNVTYADTINWNKEDKTNTITSESESSNQIDTTGTHDENEQTIEEVKGNYGVTTTQALIKQFRELIINIEQMIIKDDRIKELFMLVY